MDTELSKMKRGDIVEYAYDSRPFYGLVLRCRILDLVPDHHTYLIAIKTLKGCTSLKNQVIIVSDSDSRVKKITECKKLKFDQVVSEVGLSYAIAICSASLPSRFLKAAHKTLKKMDEDGLKEIIDHADRFSYKGKLIVRLAMETLDERHYDGRELSSKEVIKHCRLLDTTCPFLRCNKQFFYCSKALPRARRSAAYREYVSEEVDQVECAGRSGTVSLYELRVEINIY